MNESQRNLIDRMHREAIQLRTDQGSLVPAAAESAQVHHTELPEAEAHEPLASEWNAYRRQVGRLLAEGLEGRFVLIKGEEIIGVYDTWAEARAAGLQRFLRDPFLVQPVREDEPALRIRGVNVPWLG